MMKNSKVSCLPVALDLHLHPCHLQHHLAPVIDSENESKYFLLYLIIIKVQTLNRLPWYSVKITCDQVDKIIILMF